MPLPPPPPGPSESVKAFVKQRAQYRCEYCRLTAVVFHADHIIPWRLWAGSPEAYHHPANLACACIYCNSTKQDAVDGPDALSGAQVPLYNPRAPAGAWEDHFAWSDDYREIIPVSAIGRATMAILKMNRTHYKDQRALLRNAWLGGGDPWP